MKTVLSVLPVNAAQRLRLTEAAGDWPIRFGKPDSFSRVEIASAEILLGNVPADLIRASERLELLQLNSAGADAYLRSGVLAPSTVLCNATGAYSRAVSEHAFTMMLMLQKNMLRYRDQQLRQLWLDGGSVVSPVGSTVLVVGLGDIGLAFARLCKAMGAYVIGVKRRASPCPEGVDELYTAEKTDELLPRADVVMSVLPGTEATAGFFSRERFRLMKKTAIFLNVGRGGAAKSGDLAWALESGEIAAAGIDVTDPEPLPADSPLWRIENLFITPHVAGGFHLEHTMDVITAIACENLRRLRAGLPLRNVVDPRTGYKK